MICRLRDGGGSELAEAWAWFIDRYKPAIRNLLRRRLGRQRADEAEAQFWGYLYDSRVFQRLDQGRQFRRYLFGVVVNFAHSFVRGDGRRLPANCELEVDPTVQMEPAVEQQELHAWASHLLQLALDDLAREFPEQVQTLRWYYGLQAADGSRQPPLSVAAIVQRLGSNQALVHQHLSRGRVRLRQRLEADIRETVADRDGLAEELQTVLGALSTQAPGLLG